jgi:hypothetical protein
VLRKAAIVLTSAALGAAAALGVAACGEDRGGVEVEGGTTGTSGTITAPTTPTDETETGSTSQTETRSP